MIQGKAARPLFGQSALQAYRSDIAAIPSEATSDDQATILVATLLRQSFAAQDAETASRLRDEALNLARGSLGEALLQEGCTYDDHAATSTSDVIRLLAQRADHDGRLHLARHLLESAFEMEDDPIERGRVNADRGRVTRKLGDLDLGQEQHLQLLREARQLRSAELLTKAHQGLAALAQTRGNFVEYRSRIRTALRIARANGLKILEATSYGGLGTSESMSGRYGNAVAYFWKEYTLGGSKRQLARTALGNLAQTLLVSGRPHEARKVATLLLQRAPRGTLAPFLGTYAVASAQLADPRGVRWASTEVFRLATAHHYARELAEALMECSAALEAIGDKEKALMAKRQSEEMASRFGFHSLQFEEAMVSVQRIRRPVPFNAAAARAAAAIEELTVPEPPGLLASAQV